MAEILKNNSYMALPSSIKRGNPAPLDVTEIWFSYEEMALYAATNATAYVGQVMALVDETNNEATAYIIMNKNGDLQEIGAGILTDDLTVEMSDEGVISLHDFGKQYYRYVPAVDDEPAKYVLQVVDDAHPWIAGLEPRVALQDSKLVLGWYEPNPTTIEGVNNQVSSIQTTVTSIQGTIGTPSAGENVPATGLYALIDDKASHAEVDAKVAEAVAKSAHLSRVIVESVDDIKNNYLNKEDVNAQEYIFMVPTGLTEDDDKYNEYMVIEVNGVEVVEKVGDWAVDLSNYVTYSGLSTTLTEYAKTADVNNALDNKVEKVDGHSLVADADIAKLQSLANIKSVAPSIFTLGEDGVLGLNASAIDISNNSSITNLNATITTIQGAVDSHATSIEAFGKTLEEHNLAITGLQSNVQGLQTTVAEHLGKINKNAEDIVSLQDELDNLNTSVTTNTNAIVSLNEQIAALDNKFVSIEDYETDMADMMKMFEWQEIPTT